MKKHALAIFFVFIALPACYSQSLRLSNASGPLENGAIVVLSGPPDTLQLITWLHITNISEFSVRVLMKKEHVSMLPGTVSSICWAGYCYGPDMMVSTFPLDMAPAQTDTGCFSHFGPNGIRGTSVVRWTWFDQANPNDSVSLTVHYATYPAAVGELPSPGPRLRLAGPNPAAETVLLSYALPAGRSGDVELRDPSGKVTATLPGMTGHGTARFDVSGLPSGVYLCILKAEGKAAAYCKVIVLR